MGKKRTKETNVFSLFALSPVFFVFKGRGHLYRVAV